MDKFLKTFVFTGMNGVTLLLLLPSLVFSYPADHREDTVLPFSLSPGNVNLETYYLDKYPQPGIPGGPLMNKKPTSQMTPSPLDPAPVPESSGNMFYAHHKPHDPHALFRSRRATHADPQYPGSHRSQLYTEDNLHLQYYPRHHGSGGGGHFEHQQDEHEYYSRNRHHQHQHYHPALPEHYPNNRYHHQGHF